MLKKIKKSLNKKPEKNTVRKSRPSSKNDENNTLVDRHQMIQEAAYYRAESRNFIGGDPVEDWIAAEIEVENN